MENFSHCYFDNTTLYCVYGALFERYFGCRRLKWHNPRFYVFSFENVLELRSCVSTAIIPRCEHSFNDYMKRFMGHIAAVIVRIMECVILYGA